MLLVIGRAGWGTIWICQTTNTPFQHLSYTMGDDPEVIMNVRTLEEVDILKATTKQRENFESMNGIDFVAEKILNYSNS